AAISSVIPMGSEFEAAGFTVSGNACWYETPPTITCGRALQTGRIRPRASGLSASLFPSQDGDQECGDLHFAGRAAPQAGDPDGCAVDSAGALPAEPADLTERVEPAGMWAQADVVQLPTAGALALLVDDPWVPIADAAARRVAGP